MMTTEPITIGPHGSWDASVAAKIDHTLLRADAQPAEIEKLCDEAKAFNFAAVCVNPWFIPLAKDRLQGSAVALCTVIGFPLGANSTDVKVFEAEKSFAAGAVELDVVLNTGALKAGDTAYVARELSALRRFVPQALYKLILETCNLSHEEIALACQLAADAGFEYVKTSTGFGSHGATVEHVSLMRASIRADMQVKASGGIKERSKALELVAAGASRIGSSQSAALVRLENPSVL
ncbi:MAG TPA: deoxyribose-phosphate aldolase [Oligoflexus sp.]|uniref:deoxyribose-phosphate aldolase n=1 Tax=Oligoflexus sp. TaxID=1971216 RepID=UPI002D45C3F4|nr:deoxyribose-phosphate aldolase [Oligoflexus sp.]HYX38125.1 deoxyribose-phosphate aldolase [Oligoflexus sp.]